MGQAQDPVNASEKARGLTLRSSPSNSKRCSACTLLLRAIPMTGRIHYVTPHVCRRRLHLKERLL